MSDFPQRKSPRLCGYDYSQEGAYFVTICVQNRLCLFGEITSTQIITNTAGDMVGNYWLQLSTKFDDVQLDCYVVMPNHFHGILFINRHNCDSKNSLSDVMRWFKAMTSNAYIRGVKSCGWKPFPGKLWQRSYHDHIIRNERDLTRIREYVLNNPARWAEDIFYTGK